MATAEELQDKTVEELSKLAAEAEIEGRSKLDKDGLVAALADDVDTPEATEEDRAPFRREGSGADELGLFATAAGAAGDLDADDLEELAEAEDGEVRIAAARAAAQLRDAQDEEGVPARFRRRAVVDPRSRQRAQRRAQIEEESLGTARSRT